MVRAAVFPSIAQRMVRSRASPSRGQPLSKGLVAARSGHLLRDRPAGEIDAMSAGLTRCTEHPTDALYTSSGLHPVIMVAVFS